MSTSPLVSANEDDSEIHSPPDENKDDSDNSKKIRFKIKLSAHGIRNGLLRIKLDMNALDEYYHRHPDHFIFKLEHQISTKTKWKKVTLSNEHVNDKPESHINVRVDTELSAYSMQFRLSTMTKHTLPRRRGNAERSQPIILKKNKWSKWSDIIQIEIPSMMKDHLFEVNDWVNFKYWNERHNQDVYSYGTITNKLYIPAENKCIYKVAHYLTGKEYEVPQIIGNKKENEEFMGELLCDHYLDISHSISADMMLLIGDRKRKAKKVYSALGETFYTQYALDIFGTGNEYRTHVDYISMAKCVAFNVVEFLWSKKGDRGYKIRCCLMNDDKTEHFDDSLTLYPMRQFDLLHASELDGYYGDSWWYCDICFCRQGNYGWMYRCQKNKKYKYNGHDICLLCVYDMIKRYNQLNGLLQDLLSDDLTNDCTQLAVTYTVGDVVKL